MLCAWDNQRAQAHRALTHTSFTRREHLKRINVLTIMFARLAHDIRLLPNDFTKLPTAGKPPMLTVRSFPKRTFEPATLRATDLACIMSRDCQLKPKVFMHAYEYTTVESWTTLCFKVKMEQDAR